jgi:UDP-4-amino-4,6-dideoxy-N-acetyl-beta-L-altrosamine N-acetyltransferase
VTEVKLRDLRAGDKDTILAWRNSPEVARYMYTQHRISQEEHDRWFAGIAGDPTRRYWIVVADGIDVGLVSLNDIDYDHRRCSWAFYLAHPSVRGKGVGSAVEETVLAYVFDTLEMNKLCCEVLDENARVVQLHERFGFVREGLLREHVILSDGPADVVVLGLLRREWRERGPATQRGATGGETGEG